MGDPNARFGVGPSNNGGQFVGNRVADETLQMTLQNSHYFDSDLVQYMELDEFLDECDLSFDQQNQAGVSELNIEDFLDNKNDQAFEIQENQDQAARSPKDLLVREAQLNSGNNQEQNQNKRRRSSAASTSNSSSSSNNSTSSLTTASIKTDFGGLGLNNSGITLNTTPFQGVRVQQITGIQPTQFVSVQQAPSQNILPPVTQQNNKKQQQILQNSQAQQSRIVQPSTSVAAPITKQPRKAKNSRQKKQTQQPQPAQQPLIELNPVRSGPITLNRSLSATNPSVVVPREPVQRSLSFSTANPQNPRGSKIGATSIVNSNPATPATPQTPETPGSPRDIDLDEAFAVPESPASTAGGSKAKRKRKQSISDNLKDDKYWERRRKNNAAAKRSREERLQKEAEVARQANGLVAENTELKRSLAEALLDNQQLKERLAKYEKVC